MWSKTLEMVTLEVVVVPGGEKVSKAIAKNQDSNPNSSGNQGRVNLRGFQLQTNS